MSIEVTVQGTEATDPPLRPKHFLSEYKAAPYQARQQGVRKGNPNISCPEPLADDIIKWTGGAFLMLSVPSDAGVLPQGACLRIIGIDPGLVDTGYGIVDVSGGRVRLVEAGLVRTTAATSVERRLKEIFEGVSSLLSEHSPAAVIVEDLYTSYRHPRTAVLMGHARGVILLAASSKGLEVVSYAPARVKKALTGRGRASKEQIQRMVQARLGLEHVPEPDHVADALALALCHHNHLMHAARVG